MMRVKESIGDELARLEETGRVSARDRRPIHRDFGFASLAPSPLRDPQPQQSQEPVPALAAELDDAWSRLKSKIDPS